LQYDGTGVDLHPRYLIWKFEEDEEKVENLQQLLQGTPLDIIKADYDNTDSVESIYEFGHDENQKWTYAGKRPQVPETLDEKTDDANVFVKERSKKNETNDEN